MTSAMPETTPVTEMAELVRRLRAPAYWMSGSNDGHEGENNAPREAADLIEALSTRTPEAAQVEITDAMIEAGVRVLDSRSQDGTFRDDVRRIYAAMHDVALAQVRHPLEKEG